MPKFENKVTFTRILAVTGTVFAWIPIAFTILTAVIGTIASMKIRFDYLMPAELFPFAFVGVILLLWSAKRAHLQMKLIAWSLVIAVIFLVGGQVIAVVTGLASGETEPSGMPLYLVTSSLAIFSLAQIGLGIGGLFILKRMFSKMQPL